MRQRVALPALAVEPAILLMDDRSALDALATSLRDELARIHRQSGRR
jgi:ABC-type sulfate/molybdate transport systems ATPase subunit